MENLKTFVSCFKSTTPRCIKIPLLDTTGNSFYFLSLPIFTFIWSLSNILFSASIHSPKDLFMEVDSLNTERSSRFRACEVAADNASANDSSAQNTSELSEAKVATVLNSNCREVMCEEKTYFKKLGANISTLNYHS